MIIIIPTKLNMWYLLEKVCGVSKVNYGTVHAKHDKERHSYLIHINIAFLCYYVYMPLCQCQLSL